jgi:CheY-like chemotaxis protein
MGTAGRDDRTLRVLVVDDYPEAASVLGEVLAVFGCSVEIAHDATTALDIATKFAPDLALVDIGLPVIDGYELVARLRRLDTAPKRIVAVTGYGDRTDRARSHDAGFDEHVVKPLEIEAVRDIVERAR